MQLSPEEQEMALQQHMQQMQTEQTEQSLTPEQQQEYSQMPEEQRQQYLEQVVSEQQSQEALSQDPNYQKQQIEDMTKSNPQKLQDMANVYNRITPEQRKVYEDEMMKEDTETYAKVKELADSMSTYTYVAKLLNADTSEADAIWQEITVTRPEIADEVYNQIEQQLLYVDQATKYAIQLNLLKGNTKEWSKMFDDLNTNSPEAFRKMVYNEYAKVITGHKEKETTEFHLNTYAKTVAGSLSAMNDKERNNFLVAIKSESPDLYARVMKNYMDLDLAGAVPTSGQPFPEM